MKTMVLNLGSCSQRASRLGLWQVDAAVKIELESQQKEYRPSGRRNFTSDVFIAPKDMLSPS